MIRSFRDKLREALSEGGPSRVDSRLRARVLRRLDRLDAATLPEDMNLPGFNFHALRGFRPVRYMVHVNGPWYITFTFEDGGAEAVDLEQYHRGAHADP